MQRVVVPTLTDGDVVITGHHDRHIQGSFEQCQDPVSQQWTTVPIPYSLDDAKRFIRDVMPGGWASDQEWGFAVEYDGQYAGTISLRNRGDHRAEIAYGSHPRARGTGAMERALRLLLEWGFAERDLETVIWWANERNWASRKLAWRLGFTFSGTVPHWLPQRGELLNAWVGGLTRDMPRSPATPWLEAPRIVGDRVVLRWHRAEDVDLILDGMNDPEVRHWLGHLEWPFTRAMAEATADHRMAEMAAGTAVHWIIADPATHDLLGTVSVMRIAHGAGEVGYWTHPAARGRGVTQEAVARAVRHAFVDTEDGGLGLRRLVAHAAVGNEASHRVLVANGFRPTGVERDAAVVAGESADLAGYDLLRRDVIPSRGDSDRIE